MEVLNSMGVLLGSSWASGVNLYMTVAGLGIAQRAGWIELPGNMDTFSSPESFQVVRGQVDDL